jgi:hypothetical protein
MIKQAGLGLELINTLLTSLMLPFHLPTYL